MLVSVVTHLVAAAAGAFGGVKVWPAVSAWWAKLEASRAVKDAAALVAKAEADAKALDAARKLVAAHPVVAPTGATGVTGSA